MVLLTIDQVFETRLEAETIDFSLRYDPWLGRIWGAISERAHRMRRRSERGEAVWLHKQPCGCPYCAGHADFTPVFSPRDLR